MIFVAIRNDLSGEGNTRDLSPIESQFVVAGPGKQVAQQPDDSTQRPYQTAFLHFEKIQPNILSSVLY